MKILKECNKKTLGELKSYLDRYEKDGLKLRPVKFLISRPVKSGMLYYNTLTEGLIYLNDAEAFPETGSEISSFPPELFETGFMVPEDFDEFAFVDDIRYFEELKNSLKTPYRLFYVYPTTGCNARCFYCFEEGIPVRKMSTETAEKTAAFIIRNAGNSPVRIFFFGGEPTTEPAVIDFICERLNMENVKFTSVFKTNGYLLSEEKLKIMAEKYHTALIQIPIDGTEESYNKTKAYVNTKPGESAFKKVLSNIGLALSSGIDVDIRLNIGLHNAKEVPDILKTLVSSYGKYPSFGIFPQVLNEGGKEFYTEEERTLLFRIQKESYRYLLDHGVRFGQNRFRLPEFKRNSCMADSPECIGITPEGLLSKCPENIHHDKFCGSVYDTGECAELNTGDTPEKYMGYTASDFKNNADYFSIKKERTECGNCAFYPSCVILANCIGRQNPCNDAHKDFRLWKTEECMDYLFRMSESEN